MPTARAAIAKSATALAPSHDRHAWMKIKWHYVTGFDCYLFEQRHRLRVLLAPKKLIQRLPKHAATRDTRKQRHRRPKLQIIRKPKDRAGGIINPIHQPSAFLQASAQNRMPQISFSLGPSGHGITRRHLTPAQSPNLRKDEPHPVRGLSPPSQLLKHHGVDPILRLHESRKIVNIIRVVHLRPPKSLHLS